MAHFKPTIEERTAGRTSFAKEWVIDNIKLPKFQGFSYVTDLLQMMEKYFQEKKGIKFIVGCDYVTQKPGSEDEEEESTERTLG